MMSGKSSTLRNNVLKTGLDRLVQLVEPEPVRFTPLNRYWLDRLVIEWTGPFKLFLPFFFTFYIELKLYLILWFLYCCVEGFYIFCFYYYLFYITVCFIFIKILWRYPVFHSCLVEPVKQPVQCPNRLWKQCLFVLKLDNNMKKMREMTFLPVTCEHMIETNLIENWMKLVFKTISVKIKNYKDVNY